MGDDALRLARIQRVGVTLAIADSHTDSYAPVRTRLSTSSILLAVPYRTDPVMCTYRSAVVAWRLCRSMARTSLTDAPASKAREAAARFTWAESQKHR